MSAYSSCQNARECEVILRPDRQVCSDIVYISLNFSQISQII